MRTFREWALARANLLPAAVDDAFLSVLFGRLLVEAHAAGLFAALAAGAATPEELASSLHIDAGAAALLLDALREESYLRRDAAGRYRLAPQSRKWLLPASPSYIGNFLEYVGLLHRRWDRLGEALRSGRSPAPYPAVFSDDDWRVYTYGMADLARLILPRIRRRLAVPSGASALLDVGGSHGLYTADILRRHPGVRATIVDLPQVLPHTEAILRREGFSASLLPSTGDPPDIPKGPFDVVLLFNLIHGYAPEENRRLLKAIAAETRGALYILDEFTGVRKRGAGNLLPLLVGINLINEIGGRTHAWEEVAAWCRQAGFANVSYAALPLPGTGLMTCRL